jgi:hypothetical protein
VLVYSLLSLIYPWRMYHAAITIVLVFRYRNAHIEREHDGWPSNVVIECGPDG